MKSASVSVEKLDLARQPQAEEVPLAAVFSGTVTVEIPGYEERQKSRIENAFHEAEGDSMAKARALIEYEGKLAHLAKKQIKAVDLKLKADPAQELKSLEDVEQFEFYGRFVQAVAFVVMKGIPLGNG